MSRFRDILDVSQMAEDLPDLAKNKAVHDGNSAGSTTVSAVGSDEATLDRSAASVHKRRRRRKAQKSKELDKHGSMKSPATGDLTEHDVDSSLVVPLLLAKDDSFGLRPRGFQNVKNSCYLNASLQMLLHIPALCQFFRQLQNGYLPSSVRSIPTESDRLPIEIKENTLTKLLINLFSQFLPAASKHTSSASQEHGSVKSDRTQPSKSPHDPTTFTISRCTVPVSVSSGSDKPIVKPFVLGAPITLDAEFMHILGLDSGFQEDGAECLTRMLSKLHEEVAELKKGQPNPPSSTNGGSDAGNPDDFSDWIVTDRTGKRRPEARKTELEGGQSVISDLFAGALIMRSTVTHPKTRQVPSNSRRTGFSPVSVDEMTRAATCLSTKEPFFIIPLEINDPKIGSIESALYHLSEVEQVSNYRDNLSGMLSTVHQRVSIDALPPYLLLQLKRFSYGPSSPATTSRTNAPSPNAGGTSNGTSVRSGSWTIEKTMKQITVHSELIVPAKLLSQEKSFVLEQRHYRLRAVIFHVGWTAASGHYTIAIRASSGPNCPAIKSNDKKNNFNVHDSFVYFDDTRACSLYGSEAIHLLLATHRPLDASNCVFYTLPKTMPTTFTDITKQPRTPYILVYECVSTSDCGTN
ncbi:unnamed protein product [Calicophoron daubneyi]|uniref:ubiquitinyl hydrolase 1 n=1 Tax=Calicophoron daubneyi TaxID=300641 RepID=A0AAV2TG67_CALDB